jgi:hypothetical protein
MPRHLESVEIGHLMLHASSSLQQPEHPPVAAERERLQQPATARKRRGDSGVLLPSDASRRVAHLPDPSSQHIPLALRSLAAQVQQLSCVPLQHAPPSQLFGSALCGCSPTPYTSHTADPMRVLDAHFGDHLAFGAALHLRACAAPQRRRASELSLLLPADDSGRLRNESGRERRGGPRLS